MQVGRYIKPLWKQKKYEKFLGVAGDELVLMHEKSRCIEEIEGAQLMADIHYISIDEARDIHLATIRNSGGGDCGELDIGNLKVCCVIFKTLITITFWISFCICLLFL